MPAVRSFVARNASVEIHSGMLDHEAIKVQHVERAVRARHRSYGTEPRIARGEELDRLSIAAGFERRAGGEYMSRCTRLCAGSATNAPPRHNVSPQAEVNSPTLVSISKRVFGTIGIHLGRHAMIRHVLRRGRHRQVGIAFQILCFDNFVPCVIRVVQDEVPVRNRRRHDRTAKCPIALRSRKYPAGSGCSVHALSERSPGDLRTGYPNRGRRTLSGRSWRSPDSRAPDRSSCPARRQDR